MSSFCTARECVWNRGGTADPWNSGTAARASQRPGSGSGANNWLWRLTLSSLSRFLEIGRGPRPVSLTSLRCCPCHCRLTVAFAVGRLVDYCLDLERDSGFICNLYYGTDNLAETQQSQIHNSHDNDTTAAVFCIAADQKAKLVELPVSTLQGAWQPPQNGSPAAAIVRFGP